MITRRLLRPSSAWTCPSCTRAASLLSNTPFISTPTSSPSPCPTRTFRRTIHGVPPMPYDTLFKTRGIPGLLSPQSYEMAWSQYQQMLMDKLNELTAGTPFYNAHPKDLVMQFARDPQSASLFNHASMAHNNHMFFLGLAQDPRQLSNYPDLQRNLEASFGSIETLRATMLDTASAMFGPGYVWLVWAKDLEADGAGARKGSWRLLTTYLAGTPYPEAGYRQQGVDMATQSSATAADYYSSLPVNTVGSFGSHSKMGREQARLPPGGTSVLPLLCVSTWQHVYLRDYGVAGKRQFLHDWWEAIDWHTVFQNAPLEAKAETGFMSNFQSL